MFFTSEYADIEWNEEYKIAELIWKKFAADENFREPCRKTVELMKQNGAKFWFSDTLKISSMKEEDVNFFVSEIVPAVLALGVKEQALVVPQSVVAKMGLTSATEKVDEEGLKTYYFASRNEALKWIKEHS